MPSIDSKNNFALLRNKILKQDGKEYWRSLEEFVDAPEFADFVSQEYPEHAETWDNSLSRRNFVKVMGASLALAGLSGCVIQPPEKIVPYVRPQEDPSWKAAILCYIDDAGRTRNGTSCEII